MWGVSPDTIRRLFEGEPGVLKIGNPKPFRRRKYVSIRVPESVVKRVHHKLCSVPIPVKV
jgi:hypothetical protein